MGASNSFHSPEILLYLIFFFELLFFVKLIKQGDSYTEGALLLGWTKA